MTQTPRATLTQTLMNCHCAELKAIIGLSGNALFLTNQPTRALNSVAIVINKKTLSQRLAMRVWLGCISLKVRAAFLNLPKEALERYLSAPLGLELAHAIRP